MRILREMLRVHDRTGVPVSAMKRRSLKLRSAA